MLNESIVFNLSECFHVAEMKWKYCWFAQVADNKMWGEQTVGGEKMNDRKHINKKNNLPHNRKEPKKYEKERENNHLNSQQPHLNTIVMRAFVAKPIHILIE